MYNYNLSLGEQALTNMQEQDEFQRLRKELNMRIDNASKQGLGKVRFDYFLSDENQNILPLDSIELMKENFLSQGIKFQYRIRSGLGYQFMMTWFEPRYL